MIDPYAELSADEERVIKATVWRPAAPATLKRAKQADAAWRKERAALRQQQQTPPKKPKRTE